MVLALVQVDCFSMETVSHHAHQDLQRLEMTARDVNLHVPSVQAQPASVLTVWIHSL